jgi:hypothetical protein
MSNFECQECGTAAVTHVLVNYNHTMYEPGQYFCRAHAFDDDRDQCHICEGYSGSEIKVTEGNEERLLKPTYPLADLDRDHMCADHP